jgi:hypothetical protein
VLVAAAAANVGAIIIIIIIFRGCCHDCASRRDLFFSNVKHTRFFLKSETDYGIDRCERRSKVGGKATGGRNESTTVWRDDE